MVITLAAVIAAYALLATHIVYMSTTIERHITMTGQAIIDQVTTQLGKVKEELLTTLADLNAQIAAAGVAEQIDTTALEAAAQALDDIVPDVPEVEADAPADEPPFA